MSPLGLKLTASVPGGIFVLYWLRPLDMFHILSMSSRAVLKANRPFGCTERLVTSFLQASETDMIRRRALLFPSMDYIRKYLKTDTRHGLFQRYIKLPTEPDCDSSYMILLSQGLTCGPSEPSSSPTCRQPPRQRCCHQRRRSADVWAGQCQRECKRPQL